MRSRLGQGSLEDFPRDARIARLAPREQTRNSETQSAVSGLPKSARLTEVLITPPPLERTV